MDCDIGWLHAQEISLEEVPKGFEEFIYRQFALNYHRLLSSEECLSILALLPDAHGIWKYEEELSHEGPFR